MDVYLKGFGRGDIVTEFSIIDLERQDQVDLFRLLGQNIGVWDTILTMMDESNEFSDVLQAFVTHGRSETEHKPLAEGDEIDALSISNSPRSRAYVKPVKPPFEFDRNNVVHRVVLRGVRQVFENLGSSDFVLQYGSAAIWDGLKDYEQDIACDIIAILLKSLKVEEYGCYQCHDTRSWNGYPCPACAD